MILENANKISNMRIILRMFNFVFRLILQPRSFFKSVRDMLTKAMKEGGIGDVAV